MKSPFLRRFGMPSPFVDNEFGAGFSPTRLFALAEPGVWYDPSDVANLNWRRNLLTYSEAFDNAVWVKTNATVTSNSDTAPDGTATADKIVENTATSTHFVSQAVTLLGQQTVSAYAKASGRNFFRIGNTSGTTSPQFQAVFNLSTGATVSATGCTSTIEAVGNGWYRCTATATLSGGTGPNIYIGPMLDGTTANYTGDGTSGILIWGAQLELGSTVTEYQRITDVNTEVIERFPTATLYQDTAGTTPVTTPGQTVALALDKSKGLVLGSELVTNGDFSNGSTGWTLGAGWSVTGGAAVRDSTAGGSNLSGGAGVEIGKTYRITWTQTGSSFVAVYLGSAAGPLVSNTGTAGTYSVLAAATVTGGIVFRASAAVSGVDNISVRELPGFHATQATAASRPTYGIVPATGRRNLLTYSEDFSNAAWVTAQAGKSSTTEVVAAIANAPLWRITEDTATNRHEIRQNIPAATIGQNYVLTVYAKQPASNSRRYLQVFSSFTNDFANFDLQSGTVTAGVGSITFVGSGVYRLQVPMLAASAGTIVYFALANSGTLARAGSYTGDGVSNLLITGAQLETGSTATAYQRVGSAFDVTEAGVASLSYLSFDGVDDFLQTPTITPGIDKAQVFAGVRKLSDAASAILLESSAAIGGNNGAIALFAPGVSSSTDRFTFASKGTGSAFSVATSSTFAAPVTSVVTGLGDIASDISRVRANGVQQAENTADQGTGNYLAYPLYIGRRNGATLAFNGFVFSLIVRFGTNLDAATISNTEVWVGGKTQDMFAPVITGVPTIGVA